MELNINTSSRVPKYRQIVNSVMHGIARGNFSIGQKIPSINEISEYYYLSRDTVERAYSVLKDKKIIVATKGKGYYVAKTDLRLHVKILFLLNKPSSYKMMIYNSFIEKLGGSASVDLEIFHCNEQDFLQTLEKSRDDYDYYVIMPHFKNNLLQHINNTPRILTALGGIAKGKLILVDNLPGNLEGPVTAVYQDFKNDLVEALQKAERMLRRYNKIVLLYPRQSLYPYPLEILLGFRKFCVESSFEFEIWETIPDDLPSETGNVYITIDDTDLVKLVKYARERELRLGKDIGVISYNDTPMKDLLGITVVTTDFQLMGETAANMILENKREKVKNTFRLIQRASL